MNALARVPAELARTIRPAIEATLTPEQLKQIFATVRFKDLATFSAPEPSIGAAVRLESGGVATLAYGKGSQLLRVDLPARDSVSAFLSEVTLPLESITWRRTDATAKPAGGRRTPKKATGRRAKAPPSKRAAAVTPAALKAAPSRRAASEDEPSHDGKGSSGRAKSARHRLP